MGVNINTEGVVKRAQSRILMHQINGEAAYCNVVNRRTLKRQPLDVQQQRQRLNYDERRGIVHQSVKNIDATGKVSRRAGGNHHACNAEIEQQKGSAVIGAQACQLKATHVLRQQIKTDEG